MAQARKRSGDSSGLGPAPIFGMGFLAGLVAATALFLLTGEDQPEPQVANEQPASIETDSDQPTEPRYEFYTLLPEMEVIIPEDELQRTEARTQPEDEQPVESISGQPLFLQAGSFREQADAEARKAQLALLGVAASVRPVTVNGAPWYRVQAGPWNALSEVNNTRGLLAENGIETMVFKQP